MQKFLTTISILLFIAFAGYGQGAMFNWAQNYTTPIDKIELDSLSNIYSIGSGAITKRTPSGTLLWTRTITNIQSLAVTPNGDIYITGGFTGTVNFNSWGAGYPMTSAGNTDIFVSKLNANGDFVWAQRIGDVGADSATQISLDTLGHIYLTGKFTGSVDFDPGPSISLLNAGTDFILKLETSGNYVWAKELNFNPQPPVPPIPNGIQLSAASKGGHIYCIGRASPSIDLDPGIGVYNPPYLDNNFILQLDPNGNFINTSATDIWGWYPPNNIGIAVDNQNNLIYSQSDGSGNGNIHYTRLHKVNSSLSSIGNSTFTTMGTGAAFCSIHDIDVDLQNNIYVTGYFANNITIGSGYYESGYDIFGDPFDASFLVRLNPTLQVEWTRIYSKFNITNPWENGSCYGQSLAVGNNGCVYSTGTFNGYVNFNTYNTPYNMSSNTGGIYINSVCNSICNPSPPTTVNDTVMCLTSIGGQLIYTSGVYTAYYVNVGGCDSIVTINLTIEQGPDTLYANACSSYTYNNQVYTQSGIYTFPNQVYPLGCDSSTVLNLTIGIVNDTLNVLACDSITIAGVTYNTSGQYNQLVNNPNGCDTNLTLNLTVNYSQFDTTYATSCTNYTFNGVTYNTSGVFYQYYVAANICDSIKVLYLDVLQPSSSTIVQASDCSFTLNGQTYYNTGLHTQSYINAVGCDSLVYLYLTINPFVANVTQSGTTLNVQNLNVGCQWVDCNNNFSPIPNETNPYFTPNVNGSYAVVVLSNGCVDTSNCFVFNGVGFTEYIEDNTIQLYPNPTSNMVTLQSSIRMQDATLHIYDMTGALLQEQVNLNGSKFQLNLSQYANGLYQIEIVSQGVRYRSKVRKE
jgi:hypothetical protein